MSHNAADCFIVREREIEGLFLLPLALGLIRSDSVEVRSVYKQA